MTSNTTSIQKQLAKRILVMQRMHNLASEFRLLEKMHELGAREFRAVIGKKLTFAYGEERIEVP